MNDLSKSELNSIHKKVFMELCLDGVTHLMPTEWQALNLNYRLEQEIPEKYHQSIKPILSKRIIVSKCRSCGKMMTSDNFSIWVTYWANCWAPSHKECLDKQQVEEIIPCQEIDADCNDCKYFEAKNSRGNCRYGFCSKFSKNTVAYPGKCTSHECFEHRRVK